MLIPLRREKSTQPNPLAGVSQSLHRAETPLCVGPGAETGVLGPREIVVVGVTTPPTGEGGC